MRRREFITLVGGSAAAWPLANFEGLPVWRIFPRPIIGDFGAKQMDLDPSSLLHPCGSNAA
jgi:hypothetical protein